MPTVLIIEYPTQGPFGEDAADADRVLASDIAGEPGLSWKLWIEDADRQVAGGVYLFDSRGIAEAYAQLQISRLESWGINDIETRYFDVNTPLSVITRGVSIS